MSRLRGLVYYKEPNVRIKHEEPKYGITIGADTVWKKHQGQWREAFQLWQDRIWRGEYLDRHNEGLGDAFLSVNVGPKGELDLPYVTIVFDKRSGLYHAGGFLPNLTVRSDRWDVIHAEPRRGEFETALARFTRNDKIAGVVLELPDQKYLRFLVMMKTARGRLQIGKG